MSELKEVFDNDELLSGYLESVKLADFRAEVRQLVEENGSPHNKQSTPSCENCKLLNGFT